MTAEDFFNQHCKERVVTHDLKVSQALKSYLPNLKVEYNGIVVGHVAPNSHVNAGPGFSHPDFVVLGNITCTADGVPSPHRIGDSYQVLARDFPTCVLDIEVRQQPDKFELFLILPPDKLIPVAPTLPTPFRAYPHRCGLCGSPAYIGIRDVQCSSPTCRHFILVN